MRNYFSENRFVFQQKVEGQQLEGGAQKGWSDSQVDLNAAREKAMRALDTQHLTPDQKGRIEAALKKSETAEFDTMKAEQAKKTADALRKQLEETVRAELTKSYESFKALLPDAQKDCYERDEKARVRLDRAQRNYELLGLLVDHCKSLKEQNADPNKISEVQAQIKDLYGTSLVKDENLYLFVDRPNAEHGLQRLRMIESKMWLLEDALGINTGNPARTKEQPDADHVKMPDYLPPQVPGRPAEPVFEYIKKGAGISGNDLMQVPVEQGVDFD